MAETYNLRIGGITPYWRIIDGTFYLDKATYDPRYTAYEWTLSSSLGGEYYNALAYMDANVAVGSYPSLTVFHLIDSVGGNYFFSKEDGYVADIYYDSQYATQIIKDGITYYQRQLNYGLFPNGVYLNSRTTSSLVWNCYNSDSTGLYSYSYTGLSADLYADHGLSSSIPTTLRSSGMAGANSSAYQYTASSLSSGTQYYLNTQTKRANILDSPLSTSTSSTYAPVTVSFNSNGGTTPSFTSKTAYLGETYNLGSPTGLPTTSRTGYTFNGWYTESSGGTIVTTSTIVTNSSAHTLYAQWTPNPFVITLDANGGTTASNNQISVTYGTSIESFATNMRPTRNDYLFKGYYTETSGGTQRISPTAYVALTSTTYTSAVTLYAQWDYAPTAPTVRATNSNVFSTDVSSVTVTLPTGHAAGDLLIIGVSRDGTGSFSSLSGWTAVTPQSNGGSILALWYKTRGTSESNPSVSWTTGVESGTWFSIAITAGTWSGTPEFIGTTGSNTSPNPPSFSPSWGYGQTLWLALNGWDGAFTSTTITTNYTLMTYQAGFTIGAGHRTFQRANQVATEDPGSTNLSGSTTWSSFTAAVKPATYSGPTVAPQVTSIECAYNTMEGSYYVYYYATNKDGTATSGNYTILEIADVSNFSNKTTHNTVAYNESRIHSLYIGATSPGGTSRTGYARATANGKALSSVHSLTVTLPRFCTAI